LGLLMKRAQSFGGVMMCARISVLVAVVVLIAAAGFGQSSQNTVDYVTSKEATTDHERFAGGSACCNCQTEHFGALPVDFPAGEVSTVTFYLTMSRSNSYYTRIKTGPTALTLKLGERSSVATSRQVQLGTHMPVEAPWVISFPFKPPASVEPGLPWRLVDGDNDIYSAVGLFSSDVDMRGLPGTYKVSGCQYNRSGKASYAVRFEFASVETPTPLIREEFEGPIRERVYKSAVVEFAERGDLGIPDAGAIIAEWMTTSLNATGAFEVYERLSLSKVLEEHEFEMSDMLDEETIAQIGRMHGVEAIVTGSVLKFGDIISVTAKVIDVETARIIDSADVKTTDVNAISSEIEKLAFLLASDE
jgi:hypothetical protein